MSTLAETYALQAGVRLDKPYIFEKFYPLDIEPSKAILLHASAGNNNFPAKIYDYYHQVIEMLHPIVSAAGYKIFQIGGAGEQPVKLCENLCGKTDINQTAYLLRHCALLFGNDSMNAHIAGSFGTPLVVVYGPTDVKNHGPYWRGDKTILIESHRLGNKRPTYFSQENPKTINFIPPEQIVNSILKLLSLPQVSRKSLFFGEAFVQTIVDVYPDTALAAEFLKDVPLNIRMDMLHNEQNMAAQLSVRKCFIVMDKQINLDILRQFRHNILGIKCKINPDFPKWFIKDLKKLGVQTMFYTENLDEQSVSKMRQDFFDYCFFDNYNDKTKQDFENEVARYLNKKLDVPLNYDKLYYISNKFIMSSKGTFTSKPAFDAGQPITNFDASELRIIDAPEFWKEQIHQYIYEKD